MARSGTTASWRESDSGRKSSLNSTPTSGTGHSLCERATHSLATSLSHSGKCGFVVTPDLHPKQCQVFCIWLHHCSWVTDYWMLLCHSKIFLMCFVAVQMFIDNYKHAVCMYHLFVRNNVGTVEYRSINTNKK